MLHLFPMTGEGCAAYFFAVFALALVLCGVVCACASRVAKWADRLAEQSSQANRDRAVSEEARMRHDGRIF